MSGEQMTNNSGASGAQKMAPARTETTAPSGASWQFYRDGVCGPSDEATLRAFTDQLGVYSDLKGVSAMVMKQMWAEIDRLRSAIRGAQIAFCEDNPDAAMRILVDTGV